MSKKNIFIISVVILLIAGGAIGGYFTWQAGKKTGSSPQPIESNNQIQQPASHPTSSVSNLPANSTFQVLSQLRKSMDPLFSELQPTMFYWQEGTITSLKISGYKIQSREILTDTQNDRVLRFFENNGFVVDEFNLASGTMQGSRTGFRKDNLVCIVNEKYKAETEVSCGREK